MTLWGQEKSFFLSGRHLFANGNNPAEWKPLCTRVRKGALMEQAKGHGMCYESAGADLSLEKTDSSPRPQQ